MKIYEQITVDITNPYPLPKMQAQQGNIGRGAKIKLVHNGTLIELDKEVVNLYARLPESTEAVYLSTTVANGVITADFTNVMLSKPGAVQVEIQIIENDVEGGSQITTPIFVVEVNPSNINTGEIIASSEFNALVKALADVQEYKANGLKGDAATIQVGKVETLPATEKAFVTNSGTVHDAIFDFGIPTGNADAERKLNLLWDLNKGISYKFETDNSAAYQKKIKSGSKLCTMKSIGGKTVVMNQLVNPENSDKNKINFDENTGHFKYENWNKIGSKYIDTKIMAFKNHKYYINLTDKVRYAILYFNYSNTHIDLSKATDAENTVKKIFTVTDTDSNAKLYFNRYNVANDYVSYFDGCINLFDLTQMFGVGNEPSTPEEFDAMFPKDYYPYNSGELMSTLINEVVSSGTKEATYQIPQSIQQLEGYGWSAGTAFNYVDYENKKFVKNVGRVDLGKLHFTKGQIFVASNLNGQKLTNSENIKPNIVCSKFITVSQAEAWSSLTYPAISTNATIDGFVYISDDSFSDVDTLTNALQGVYLYYELAEPIITDISNLIGDIFQEPFEVEPGGSLTFKNSNDNRLPVPSEQEYLISIAEAN